MLNRGWSFLIFLLALQIPLDKACAQNVSLRIVPAGESQILKKLNYKKSHPGIREAQREVAAVISSLHERGFLLAAADTIISDSSRVTAVINTGQAYTIAFLKMGNLDPNLASKLGISEKLYFNKPFRYRELARSIEKIIVYYENNGYPFVRVKLDSAAVNGERFSAKLRVEPGKLYRIDSVKISGDARVNRKFIYRYLGLREGMLYNEALISTIPAKIRQLPFITEARPPETMLSDKQNKLRLFFNKKVASQFDGIVGLLPDAATRKTVLTGDLKLKLVNGLLRNGETFDLQWRRLQSQTQDLNGRITYPYLFGTPVGIDYNLKIYRRDTTFTDINNNTALHYYFSGLNHFKVFYNQRNSNLISTSGLDFATVLPDYADITNRAYGLGIFSENYDYRFNPHRGAGIGLSVQTGDRRIRKNPEVNELVYENLLLRSTQYQAEGNISWFIQLHRNNVLKLALKGATIFGNSVIFRNELFRIGGLRTLRGFDEESIFASTYVIPTLEYRFLFDRNSNLLIFAEGAWYENNSNRQYLSDTPVSVGAGINFETKAGILSLNYAIGNQLGNGFDARSGKIHFGLTALF